MLYEVVLFVPGWSVGTVSIRTDLEFGPFDVVWETGDVYDKEDWSP